MIILDEKQYAENLLRYGFYRFMSLRDLSVLSKYFYFLGDKTKDVEVKLLNYCNKFNPAFNIIISSWVIQKSMNIGKNYKLRIPIEIEITKKELDFISQLDNYKYEKILFVMLVCAKNEKKNKTKIKEKNISENKKLKYENVYFVNSKFTEILKLAKVNLSKIDRNNVLYELNKIGLIETTHNGSYKINFVDINSDVEIKVLSDENMINAYKEWKPNETIKCNECGKRIIKNSNRQIMCEDCYKESIKKNMKKYYNKNR